MLRTLLVFAAVLSASAALAYNSTLPLLWSMPSSLHEFYEQAAAAYYSHKLIALVWAGIAALSAWLVRQAMSARKEETGPVEVPGSTKRWVGVGLVAILLGTAVLYSACNLEPGLYPPPGEPPAQTAPLFAYDNQWNLECDGQGETIFTEYDPKGVAIRVFSGTQIPGRKCRYPQASPQVADPCPVLWVQVFDNGKVVGTIECGSDSATKFDEVFYLK